MRVGAAITALGMAVIAAGSAPAAWAACTTLAFSVNDYGKEGPSNDAKALLDKYAAKWTAEHGIKKFTVGHKQVSCELFLNFVLFDEHTCTASAPVCYEGPEPADAPTTAAGAQPAKKTPARTAAKPASSASAPIATGTGKQAAKLPAKAPATASAPAAAVVAVPAAAPAATAPAAPAPVAPSAAPAASAAAPAAPAAN